MRHEAGLLACVTQSTSAAKAVSVTQEGGQDYVVLACLVPGNRCRSGGRRSANRGHGAKGGGAGPPGSAEAVLHQTLITFFQQRAEPQSEFMGIVKMYALSSCQGPL